MNNSNKSIEFTSIFIRLALMGSLLTVINTTIATLALGVFQGFLVSFTTPFVFALARQMYPRIAFTSSIIYIPVILVSLFTLNLGPPGFHKVIFIISAIIYDLVCVLFNTKKHSSGTIPVWKLIIATLFYPIGLLLAAVIILYLFTINLPFISEGWIPAIGMVIVFLIMGSIATVLATKFYKNWIKDESGE